MPTDKRERIERLDELRGFLRQSNISGRNLARLEALRDHAELDVATLAMLILDVAHVLPGKRSRWLKLAQRHRPLFERAVGVLGLEYFEEVLAGCGDFESPLWDIIEDYGLMDNASASPGIPPSRAPRTTPTSGNEISSRRGREGGGKAVQAEDFCEKSAPP